MGLPRSSPRHAQYHFRGQGRGGDDPVPGCDRHSSSHRCVVGFHAWKDRSAVRRAHDPARISRHFVRRGILLRGNAHRAAPSAVVCQPRLGHRHSRPVRNPRHRVGRILGSFDRDRVDWNRHGALCLGQLSHCGVLSITAADRQNRTRAGRARRNRRHGRIRWFDHWDPGMAGTTVTDEIRA